ncbi:hypothetical protein [Phenylobacterium sp.]|uniref:hypothetical protein n=1 Tax=Phenylobacterium sp. TaxID=1871053 RepID=UPI00273610D6|nr:hypothetical protein [Phenylobacterium sp.]MDP3660922.1 hypothetical protein [Phenylobacterium sp.]
MSQANTTADPRTGPTWGVSSVLYAAMITTYSGLGALYAFMPVVGRDSRPASGAESVAAR